VLPFYAHRHERGFDDRTIAWPLYRHRRYADETTVARRTDGLLVLYRNEARTDVATGTGSHLRALFPAVIDEGHPVFGFVADAYWMDLGTPEKYLQAHFDLLAGRVRDVSYLAPWIAADADVEPGAVIGERSSVGPEARVAARATVVDSVVHAGASIATGAIVRSSIVGPGARVGRDASVTGCVLGAGSTVPDGVTISDSKVATDGEAAAS